MGSGTTPSGPPARPRFVERGGEAVYRQPFSASGVRMYAFVLEADATRLDQWYERSFAEPSGGAVRLRAASSHVVLAFAEITRMAPSEEPDSMLGGTREVEAAIWAPAYDDTDELLWTMPYVFVEQMSPIAGGREIYGFPKQLGRITGDFSADAPTSLSVDALAVRTFGPKAMARDERVITVSRSVGGAVPEAWTDIAEGHRQLLRQARATEPVRSDGGGSALEANLAGLLVGDIVRCKVPLAFLKQFRSCSAPELACYQAIVRVDLGLAKPRGAGRLPDDYTVTLEVLDSEPLVADLGLRHRQANTLAFWVDFDFTVPRGEVVWEAGVPSP
jgi:hypothetical protein